MASLVYNHGAHLIQTQALNWDTSTAIQVLLVGTGYTADKDHEDVADVVANEIAPSGYARQAMAAASNTITKDTTNDRIVFDGPDVTFTSLGAGTTIHGAIVFADLGADADSPLICFIDLTNTVTDGGNVVIQWASTGIFYLQQ